MISTAMPIESVDRADDDSTLHLGSLVPAFARPQGHGLTNAGTVDFDPTASTDNVPEIGELLTLPVRAPTPGNRQSQFHALEKWEGRVTELGDTWFRAALFGLPDHTVEDSAVFDIEEVNEADVSMLRPGAVFYWSIGYLEQPSGQRYRSSLIRFRRLPAWTTQDRARAEQRAVELRKAIQVL